MNSNTSGLARAILRRRIALSLALVFAFFVLYAVGYSFVRKEAVMCGLGNGVYVRSSILGSLTVIDYTSGYFYKYDTNPPKDVNRWVITYDGCACIFLPLAKMELELSPNTWPL